MATIDFIDKITQGDCYELIKQIDDKSIDLIVTDPPYEIAVEHGGGVFGNEKNQHYGEISRISHGFDYALLDEYCRVLKQINIYIWCSQKQIPTLIEYFVDKKKCNWNLLTWHKTNPMPACGNKYIADTEFCLFFRESGVKLYGTADSKMTYYISQMNTADKKKYEHPCIKPIPIIENLIANSTQENEVVLDTFIGSGTTAVAAKTQNRRFIGFEIDERWCKLANDRLQGTTATGQLGFLLL